MKKKSLKTPQRRVNINSCPDEEFFRRDGGGGVKGTCKIMFTGRGGGGCEVYFLYLFYRNQISLNFLAGNPRP